jgi:hypothetical protein
MADTTQLEEVLTLALRLSPGERLRLVERVVSSVERDIEAPPANEQQPEEHWGQGLVRLLQELGPIEMVNPEIEDPVEWVQEQRRKDAERLKPYWDGEK